jgi:NAD(P)H-hydrate epimerase
MIKIVTARQMREMDKYTIDRLGIPGAVLMENAAKGAFLIIENELKDIDQPLVFVFCGKGNNGGDGFVISRYLWDSGIDVKVFIAGKEQDIRSDAKTNYQIIKKLNIPIKFISSKADLKKVTGSEPDIIVDALLGTGITGAVHGFMAEVIDYINQLNGIVISVDVPSGLNSDLPVVEGVTVEADVTVSMALPKHCHVFYPARRHVGELYVTEIGIPNSVRNSHEIKVQMLEEDDIHLPDRSPDAHKYTSGKVGVLAGSVGYTGAAILTCQAAMRIGAGLVFLGVPQKLNSIFEIKLTEAITKPYQEEHLNPHSEPLKELLDWCDVLAIGPGLGRTPEMQHTIIKILQDFKKPAIVDADALFALAENSKAMKKAHPNWVLTPHHGEFLRLLGNVSKKEFAAGFVSLAQEYATEHKLTLLLKGAPSLVACADGQVYVNPTGNSGLASGGTGDVLTGFVAGLVAQGMSLPVASYTANFLHGQCADDLIEDTAQHSLLAGDLLNEIGSVMKNYQ